MSAEGPYISIENIGKPCMYWNEDKLACGYPKAEVMGRWTCLGTRDALCLYLIKGIVAEGLSLETVEEMKLRPPNLSGNDDLPPSEA